MAEYIDRADLIKNLNKFAPEHYTALVNQLITKQPIADVVEVVRCKDCRFNKPTDFTGERACIKQCAYKKPNDFCSCGERRDT